MSSKKQKKNISVTSIDNDSDKDDINDDEKDDDKNKDDEKEKEEIDEIEDILNADEGIIDEDDEEEEDYEEEEEVEGEEGNDALSNGELEEDVKDEIENCYFQYDDLIDEYEELGPATKVPDDERITLNKLTKYEMVRILGIRAHQISVGAKSLVKNIENKSPIEIAIYELKNKMTPFKIKRPLPNNTYEIWKIKELDIDLVENEERGLIESLN